MTMTLRNVMVLGALLATASCEKSKEGAAGAPRPASVVLDFARKSDASLDGAKAFAGGVNPMGAAALDEGMLLASAGRVFGIAGTDGIDRKGAAHLLLVDHGGKPGAVLLVHVGDAGKLDAQKGTAAIEKRGGWAVIGQPELVKEVSAYALGTLAPAAVPDKPTATIYLHDLMITHAKEVEEGLAAMNQTQQMQGEMGAFMKSYFDGLLSVARDTDEIRVVLDATAQQAVLDVAMVPHAGSRFATFVAAQKPGDFSLLGKLPNEEGMMTLAGHFALGPYHDAFVAAMAQFYKTGGADVAKPFAAILDATTGNIAMRMNVSPQGGMGMTQLVDLTDAPAVSTALDTIFTAIGAEKVMDMGNITVHYNVRPAPLEHEGAKLRVLDTSYVPKDPNDPGVAALNRMTPGLVQHSAVGVADKELVFVMAPDVDAAVGRIVDALRGKAPGLQIDPTSQALLADAKSSHASFLALMDLGRFMSSMSGVDRGSMPFLLGLGSDSGALHARIVAPVASVRGMVAR